MLARFAYLRSIAGPIGLGFLAEEISFSAAWLAAAIASFAAATIIVVLRRFVLEEPSQRELREIERSMMQM